VAVRRAPPPPLQLLLLLLGLEAGSWWDLNQAPAVSPPVLAVWAAPIELVLLGQGPALPLLPLPQEVVCW
jgi:hypothetical protein